MSTTTSSGTSAKTRAKTAKSNTAAPASQALKRIQSPARKTVAKAVSAAAPAAVPVPAATPTHVSHDASKTERKKVKAEKTKVVRDSFTIPKAEYEQLARLKKRGVSMGLELKKSELLRAGLLLLSACSETAFRKAVAQVPTLKTGRPGKE
jgi:hypothetical protein